MRCGRPLFLCSAIRPKLRYLHVLNVCACVCAIIEHPLRTCEHRCMAHGILAVGGLPASTGPATGIMTSRSTDRGRNRTCHATFRCFVHNTSKRRSRELSTSLCMFLLPGGISICESVRVSDRLSLPQTEETLSCGHPSQSEPRSRSSLEPPSAPCPLVIPCRCVDEMQASSGFTRAFSER